MSVNSDSTRQQVLDAMADNASYDEDGSLVKAKAFVTACRVWLTRWAFTRSKNSESELEMPPELIQKQLEAAIEWIDSKPPATDTAASNYAGYKKVHLYGGRD